METIAWLISGGLCLGGLWFLVPFALRRHSERRLAGLCRARRTVVLSYDDGPGSGLTPRLLDLLKRHQVSATFFMLGRSIEAHPDMARRVLEDGHEIGSHSFGHANAWKVSPFRAGRDLAAGIGMIRTLGGDDGLFRPPYGKTTLATLFQGRLQRQRFGWWTVDSRDTRAEDLRRPVEQILAQIRAEGGGVVLAHDFDRPDEDRPDECTDGMPHADYVLSLTERIIEFSRENGYQIRRLGEVLQGENP